MPLALPPQGDAEQQHGPRDAGEQDDGGRQPRSSVERTAAGGQTIAHGFLLLSLTVEDDVAALTGFPGIAHVLNYGLNKVRFLAPVPSGADVRVRSRLLALEVRNPGQWLLTQHKAVEVVPGGEVALVAEQLSLIVAG